MHDIISSAVRGFCRQVKLWPRSVVENTTIISVVNGDLVRKSTCEGHKNHIMVRLSKTVARFEEEEVKKGS